MICCVILAGGSGTRLWPLSDGEMPKQFLKLFSDKSLIEETSDRLLTRAPLSAQYVLTGEKYRQLVDQAFSGGMQVLAEPCAKNTAPCILWAALKIMKDHGPDTIMAVMPSDHAIKDTQAFLIAFDRAVSAARDGSIVTFGITPTRPETGYGYIEIKDAHFTVNESVEEVCAFHEKPDAYAAQAFINTGKYLWNSGMFVFTAQSIAGEFALLCPEVYDCFKDADPDSVVEIAQAFEKTPSISLDYAVMEHTQKAVVIPSSFGWSDVGGYESLLAESDRDENGNAAFGDVILQDVENCYVRGEKRIVCVDVEGLVVVESEGTILVANKASSAKIGAIAKSLQNKGGGA